MSNDNTSGLSDFDFVRHNETDYESFKKFSEGLHQRHAEGEQSRKVEQRKAMLKTWIEEIPERYRTATLEKFEKDTTKMVSLLKSGHKGFFIHGDPLTGKTHLAYAVVRKLIAAGRLAPSQANVFAERELLNVAAMGFDGKQKLMAFTNDRFKLFLFDNAGAKESFSPKVDIPAIASIVEAAYERSAYLIITSTSTLDEYCELLYDGATALRLREVVGDGVIELQ